MRWSGRRTSSRSSGGTVKLLEVRTIVHIFKLFAPASNTFLDWGYSYKYKTCNLQIPGGYQPTTVYTWAMMPIWCQAATLNNVARKKSRTRLADKYGSFNHNGCILLTNTASNFAFTCAIAPQQLAFALECSLMISPHGPAFKETPPLHWTDASNWPTLPFSALHLIVMVQEKSHLH